jgi:L-ascorbate metabolism protein UlaG (beta-lactamase superfamily)
VEPARNRVSFYGHATVGIDLDGVRLLTDPVFSPRVGHLRRRHVVPTGAHAADVDAVLISHLHHDHLDLPSLRAFGADRRVVAPRGSGALLARHGFTAVTEVAVGDVLDFGAVRVRVAEANHDGKRAFGPTADCVGFVVEGSRRVYFAGDTDLFPGLADLGPVDVALLPVAGWGPTLGHGHLDPYRAAQALRLIHPRVAVPIHWGTLAPFGLHWRDWSFLRAPPHAFEAFARALAPDVPVRILRPGDELALEAIPSTRSQSSGDASR